MSKKPSDGPTIAARAPAKVNLGLRIIGKRQDGYHDLVSLMVPVGLCDVIRGRAVDAGVHLCCQGYDLPAGAENLAYRAASLLLEKSRAQTGLHLELYKRIPVAAGLGGGSSDAAVTLMIGNRLLGWPLSTEELFDLARQLGADVPFFLAGGPALAEGIGDILTPVRILPPLWTLLLLPGFSVATAWAYGNLTLTPGENGSKLDAPEANRRREIAVYRRRLMDETPLRLEEIGLLLVNDFEPLLYSHYPGLEQLKQQLLAAGAAAATLSGSGPTLVGLFPTREAAKKAAARLRRMSLRVELAPILPGPPGKGAERVFC